MYIYIDEMSVSIMISIKFHDHSQIAWSPSDQRLRHSKRGWTRMQFPFNTLTPTYIYTHTAAATKNAAPNIPSLWAVFPSGRSSVFILSFFFSSSASIIISSSSTPPFPHYYHHHHHTPDRTHHKALSTRHSPGRTRCHCDWLWDWGPFLRQSVRCQLWPRRCCV